jgi:very-short-patch-repair endonuclease
MDSHYNKKQRIRGTNPQVEQAARDLRTNLTPAEDYLWRALKSKQLNGLRFRSQHPVGNFILDFYCASCKLVVEVDGSTHDDRQDYDLERTNVLETYGYFVLRFTNDEVLGNIDIVLAKIAEAAEARIAP